MEWAKIFLLTLGHCACDINSGALPALLPYLAQAHGFDYATCGVLTFAFASMASIIQPAFGFISDRYPRKWYIPLGVILAGGGMAAVGLFSSFWAILLSLFICGTGSSIFHPEGARYANLVSANRKGLGISLFGIGGNAGYALGPVCVAVFVGGFSLGGITLGGFGLPGTLFFGVLCVTLALFIFNAIRHWGTSTTSREKGEATSAPTNDWGAFGILSLCIIARSILFLGYTTFLPLYYTNVFHLPETTSGSMLTIYCLFGVLSNLTGGCLADRFGTKRAIGLSWLIALPFAALFPMQTNPWIAGAMLLPIAFGCYAPFSSLVLLGQKYLARSIGFASGITLGVAVSVGGMFTPVIGYIADNYGGLPVAMHVMTAACVAGGLLTLALKNPDSRTQASRP